MKPFAGWAVPAGFLLAAWSANAQVLAPVDAGRSPYRAVSDFEEPYGGMPPAPPPYEAPYAPPAYGYAPPAYGYETALMPPHEVYAVLRENGFLPLGIPHRLGSAYEIAAMDPAGEDGRLLIDGRTGRILRFTPAYWGDESGLRPPYGAQDAMPPPTAVRGVPRPPGLIPHVASRAVPLPAPKPASARPAEPLRQSAAVQKPADAQARTAAPATGEMKPPGPQIRPTEPMPPAEGFE